MAKAGAKIHSVVFDLDDTLYLERHYVRSGYIAVAEHLRGVLADRSPQAARPDAPTLAAWLWKRFLAGQSQRAFDSLNDRFRLGLTGQDILKLVDVYRRHKPKIVPADGVPEMLGLLHADFRLALLSDGYLPAQELKLDALKLRRFFDVVIFTEQFGREAWKPSDLGFNMVQQKLGVPHEAIAYVGDNPAKDFVAPNRLRWRTVQFLREAQVHAHLPAPPGGAPQAIVRTPGELRAALLRPEG